VSHGSVAATAGRTAGVFVLSVILLWLLSLGAVLAAGAFPDERPADAILVLGAAQYNGRPSPVLRARLDHALALHRAGRARWIIFTGGIGAGDTLSEAEVSRRYAVRRGVPDSLILLERQGQTSAQSVRAATQLMRERGLRSALVVSDSYHMMRLELLVRRGGIRPFRAPAPDAPIDRAAHTTRWRYIARESIMFPATALLGGG
jgi:uncharacterized SAM-binding protein YcdF (DUF218 family)